MAMLRRNIQMNEIQIFTLDDFQELNKKMSNGTNTPVEFHYFRAMNPLVGFNSDIPVYNSIYGSFGKEYVVRRDVYNKPMLGIIIDYTDSKRFDKFTKNYTFINKLLKL